jgi:hypothetical protein
VSAFPAEAHAFVVGLAAEQRRAYEACPARPAVPVVFLAERDRETLSAALRDTPYGDHVVAAPLAPGRAVAHLIVPGLAARLDEPLEHGAAWVLVVGPTGVGVVNVAVPTVHH